MFPSYHGGMASRLYTRRGDDGDTDLFGGGRISKADLRMAAVGEVDELNAAVGFALVACSDERLRAMLEDAQHRLFELGADLATPVHSEKVRRIDPEDIVHLESEIDEACEGLPPLREFILPGGSEAAARLHLARTVCRRAERACVALGGCEQCVIFLNRLSDLLFALARRANAAAGTSDVPWRKTR